MSRVKAVAVVTAAAAISAMSCAAPALPDRHGLQVQVLDVAGPMTDPVVGGRRLDGDGVFFSVVLSAANDGEQPADIQVGQVSALDAEGRVYPASHEADAAQQAAGYSSSVQGPGPISPSAEHGMIVWFQVPEGTRLEMVVVGDDAPIPLSDG